MIKRGLNPRADSPRPSANGTRTAEEQPSEGGIASETISLIRQGLPRAVSTPASKITTKIHLSPPPRPGPPPKTPRGDFTQNRPTHARRSGQTQPRARGIPLVSRLALSIDQALPGISLGHVAVRRPDRPNFLLRACVLERARARERASVRTACAWWRVYAPRARRYDAPVACVHTPETLQERRRVKEEGERGGDRRWEGDHDGDRASARTGENDGRREKAKGGETGETRERDSQRGRGRERERASERASERERERERQERFTQTLAKLRPSLTSGYIARVNELAPTDDQGL